MGVRRVLLVGAGAGLLAVGAAVVGVLASMGYTAPQVYVVAKGDTLSAIARGHGVTVDDLRAWNGLEGDLIEVGEVLWLWPSTNPTQPGNRVARKATALPVAGSITGAGTSEGPKLQMPAEKRCLEGPALDDLHGEEGMVGSAGLSYDQIATSMGGFVHHTLSCLSGSDALPSDVLDLEVTVACTGRVSAVDVVDRGDWSSAQARCVTEVLGYAPFPAHDLPDGETFRYPLRFSPG